MDESGNKPLDNARWERYAQERASGKTQRQAMLAAYPARRSWKPETVDSRACCLEKKPQVKARVEFLQAESAKRATVTRAQVIDGMARVFGKALKEAEDTGLAPVSVKAVSAIGSKLVDVLPEVADEAPEVPPSDFGLLIAPPFLRMHREVANGTQHEFLLPGGRNSGKSSSVSLEIVDGLMHCPESSAFVAMKNGVDIKDSVWEQVVWAIERLGYSDAFDERPSLRRIVRRSTGQAIVFRGIDKANKSKGIKAPAGTYFKWQWFEEADQFRGMPEIRTVEQSVTRSAPDGAEFFRFLTYNPPRSRDSWINRERARREAEGMPVYPSTYLDVPEEWIAEQTRQDAEELRRTDEQAYRHEYLGKPVGIGGEVFDRVEFREVTDDEIRAFERPMPGQDFGWFPDPWAMTLSEWQPGTRTLITYAEDGANKLTPDRQAERVRRMLTWPDSDGEKPTFHALPVMSDDASPDIIAAQRGFGINARAAGKGNLRLASYRWLASVRWVIDPRRCPRLAEEARNKKHCMTRDGEWLEDIEDGDDHWIDATRYAVMPLVRRFRSAYRRG